MESNKDFMEPAPKEEAPAKEAPKKIEAKRPEAKKEAPPPPPPSPEQYRVLEEKTISWRGGLTKLRKDKIIDETHYGKDGIAHLQSQGVKLEKVK